MLFARGERPRAAAIDALTRDNPGFSVSLDPLADEALGDGAAGADNDAGPRGGSPPDIRWVEVLANGLTFDLAGLAPGAATPRPPHNYSFGLPKDLEILRQSEAVVVRRTRRRGARREPGQIEGQAIGEDFQPADVLRAAPA